MIVMFENFNINSFKNKKPPTDNSLKTFSELKSLQKIKMNKKFVEDHDEIKDVFKNIVGEDEKDNIQKIINKSAPIILKLKKYHNRPRPKELAKNFNIKLDNIELKSMKTPSYPSGHSTQAYLIAEVLKEKYPEKSKELDKKAKDISDSRNIARAHYKSDSENGKELGISMYKYLKNGKRS